jgi:hypothetical protein
MISVSDSQLRIVAEAADLLPSEARGTFLRRVVAEVREGRSFKDSDIEPARRKAALGCAPCLPGGFSGSSIRRIPPTDCRLPSFQSISKIIQFYQQ